MRTINTRCLVCDGPLAHVGLKPSVCGEDLCAFRHESLGLGLELGAEIARAPELLDLLISFLFAAVRVEMKRTRARGGSGSAVFFCAAATVFVFPVVSQLYNIVLFRRRLALPALGTRRPRGAHVSVLGAAQAGGRLRAQLRQER